MLPITQFRLLLASSVASALIGAGIDLALPGLVPPDLASAKEVQDQGLSDAYVFGLAAALVIAFVPTVASIYGLFRLRSWAPKWTFVSTVLGLVVSAFDIASVQSGLAMAFLYLASYMWGAILLICCSKPKIIWSPSEASGDNGTPVRYRPNADARSRGPSGGAP